jgi:Glycosyl transferases group 1
MKRIRTLLLYAASPENRTLSYQVGWPRAIAAHAAFKATLINVEQRRDLIRLRALLRLGPSRFDAVIALHSIFSNSRKLDQDLTSRLAAGGAPKAFFIGNEYKLMPEKIAFCEELRVDLLVSQITSEATLDVYRARLGCTVVGIPNTGLDPELFVPRTPWAERPVDIGYRAYDSPLYLGHDERRAIAERVADAAGRLGLRADISLEASDRLGEAGWAMFLDSCRGQLGTEAGGDFFELTDRTRLAVNAFLAAQPQAPFGEVYERFFANYEGPRISGRTLSGRIVEAAGTKTVQLLVAGEYGGYFRPDVHYIPIAKSFDDLELALEKLGDEALCRDLTNAAYDVAVSELTYDRLIDRFCVALRPLLR